MTIPSRSDDIAAAERKRRLRLLDRAYGCFAFLGLATLPFGVAAILESFGLLDYGVGFGRTLAGWVELFEFTLAIPLFVAMLVASAYGIRRAVQFGHTALVVLSVVSTVCGGGYIVVVLTDWHEGKGIVGVLTEIAFCIYLAANILIPAQWFIIGRRRYIDGQSRT